MDYLRLHPWLSGLAGESGGVAIEKAAAWAGASGFPSGNAIALAGWNNVGEELSNNVASTPSLFPAKKIAVVAPKTLAAQPPPTRPTPPQTPPQTPSQSLPGRLPAKTPGVAAALPTLDPAVARRVEELTRPGIHVCPMPNCGRQFDKPGNFTNHLMTHSDAPAAYRCNRCKLGFHRAVDLKRHLHSHSAPESCVCGKRIVGARAWRLHSAKCDVWMRQSATQVYPSPPPESLVTHPVDAFAPATPLSCECGQAFPGAPLLIAHRAVCPRATRLPPTIACAPTQQLPSHDLCGPKSVQTPLRRPDTTSQDLDTRWRLGVAPPCFLTDASVPFDAWNASVPPACGPTLNNCVRIDIAPAAAAGDPTFSLADLVICNCGALLFGNEGIRAHFAQDLCTAVSVPTPYAPVERPMCNGIFPSIPYSAPGPDPWISLPLGDMTAADDVLSAQCGPGPPSGPACDAPQLSPLCPDAFEAPDGLLTASDLAFAAALGLYAQPSQSGTQQAAPPWPPPDCEPIDVDAEPPAAPACMPSSTSGVCPSSAPTFSTLWACPTSAQDPVPASIALPDNFDASILTDFANSLFDCDSAAAPAVSSMPGDLGAPSATTSAALPVADGLLFPSPASLNNAAFPEHYKNPALYMLPAVDACASGHPRHAPVKDAAFLEALYRSPALARLGPPVLRPVQPAEGVLPAHTADMVRKVDGNTVTCDRCMSRTGRFSRGSLDVVGPLAQLPCIPPDQRAKLACAQGSPCWLPLATSPGGKPVLWRCMRCAEGGGHAFVCGGKNRTLHDRTHRDLGKDPPRKHVGSQDRITSTQDRITSSAHN